MPSKKKKSGMLILFTNLEKMFLIDKRNKLQVEDLFKFVQAFLMTVFLFNIEIKMFILFILQNVLSFLIFELI